MAQAPPPESNHLRRSTGDWQRLHQERANPRRPGHHRRKRRGRSGATVTGVYPVEATWISAAWLMAASAYRGMPLCAVGDWAAILIRRQPEGEQLANITGEIRSIPRALLFNLDTRTFPMSPPWSGFCAWLPCSLLARCCILVCFRLCCSA